MKKLLTELKASNDANASQAASHLLQGLLTSANKFNNTSHAIANDFIELLTIILSTLPTAVSEQQKPALGQLITAMLLSHPSNLVRKRSAIACGWMMALTTANEVERIVQVIKNALSEKDNENLKIVALLIGQICKCAPGKLESEMPQFLTELLKFCSQDSDEDLKEVSLQVLFIIYYYILL